MPLSRFGRLFMYSKDTAFSAHENFATEALAMCISDAQRPLLQLCGNCRRPKSVTFAIFRTCWASLPPGRPKTESGRQRR